MIAIIDDTLMTKWSRAVAAGTITRPVAHSRPMLYNL